MGNTRERVGAAGVVMAKGIFRIVLYVCIAFLIFWAGKATYEFSYSVFNEQAMSPGEGEEITVVIDSGSSVYKIGKILESRGLVKNAPTFVLQEYLSNYHGMLQAGTYVLSTAYTPTRIIEILSEPKEETNIESAEMDTEMDAEILGTAEPEEVSGEGLEP